jgi:hypothetical protein
VINENVLRVEKIDAFASQKVLESEKSPAKKRPRRARRNVLKKRQKKTNASEKKAEKGEKNVPRGGRMTWMRMREHFLGKRAFSFPRDGRKKCEHSVRNQSLTLYRIKKH